MRLTFRDATLKDVATIVALQNAASAALTARFGLGHWSSPVTERSAVLSQRHARVRVGVSGVSVLTVLRLATKKPWAIDVSYFTPVKRPLYLTGMATSVAHQREGLGRMALADARVVAGACAAYAEVIARWGHPGTKSITVASAIERAAALRCPSSR